MSSPRFFTFHDNIEPYITQMAGYAWVQLNVLSGQIHYHVFPYLTFLS